MATAHGHYVTSGGVPLDERREISALVSVVKVVPVAGGGGGVIGAPGRGYVGRRMCGGGGAVPVMKRVIAALSGRRLKLLAGRTRLTAIADRASDAATPPICVADRLSCFAGLQ